MKLLAIICSVCLYLSGAAQYTYTNLEINFTLSEKEQKSYTYQHLRLYPIKAKQSFTDTFRRVGKYLNLKEALAQGKVIITEQLGGATVNTLTIENVSNDTIMIMAGEVITGGKQNRIIGKDLILLPHSGKIDLSVYCVEAGRWENVSTGTNQFSGYFNVGSMGLRKTVDKKQNQGEVWAKVDSINRMNSTSSSTKTYTAINKSEDFTKKLKEYTDYFMKSFSAEQHIIGVVVVSGNKVLGCDMFATADLFKNNFENLLASYATDAIIGGSPVNVTPAKIKEYMDKLLNSEEEQSATIKEKGKVFINDGKKVRISSYE
ncbi:MAG: ARPP-1 family domain-containing protein [Bacteroidota bacterium]